MTAYYQIDPHTKTIISGPWELSDDYVKALTRCGNPDKLDPATLQTAGVVPQLLPTLEPGTRYAATVTVYADRVELLSEPIPMTEIRAQRIAEISAACEARFSERWPLLDRVAAQVGIPLAPDTPGLVDDLAEHLLARDAAIDAIAAAGTAAAVLAVTPVWPA